MSSHNLLSVALHMTCVTQIVIAIMIKVADPHMIRGAVQKYKAQESCVYCCAGFFYSD